MRYVLFTLFFVTHLVAAKTRYTQHDFAYDARTHAKIIFYFVSAGMPLSIRGLENTLAIAKKMGYDVQPLNDPVEPINNWHEKIPVAIPAAYTAVAGVPLHFPIILIYKNGHACGHAIPGYKTKEEYQQIISQYDQQCESLLNSNNKTHFAVDRILIATKQSRITNFRIANKLMETPIPRENIGYYFKIINNDWITYHASNQVYFFNRKTGTEFKVPGQFDSVPTPDTKFITLPAPLRFFSLTKIWDDPNNAVNLPPDFTDEMMRDEYQSIGLLDNSIYRIATAWIASITFRNYFFDKLTGIITPGDKPKTICGGCFFFASHAF